MPWTQLKYTDVIVIPALNEELAIGTVVRHFLAGGVKGQQLMLVDSGCSDATVAVALETAYVYDQRAVMRVINTAEVLAPYRHKEAGQCGIGGCDGALAKVGKGAAMYAAALALTKQGHDPEGRIFFFDGDLVNIDEVDPLGCLLAAWSHKPEARIAKLSSAKRENEGVLAAINALPYPWNRLADLAWPLCGQQSLRLGDLQKIPMPTRFSAEVALLAALVELYGPGCFTQEPIQVPLCEEQHHDDLQRYTRMFTQIVIFLQKVVELGGLRGLTLEAICSWNHSSWRNHEIGVPRVEPGGVGVREHILIDALLPPIEIIMEAGG